MKHPREKKAQPLSYVDSDGLDAMISGLIAQAVPPQGLKEQIYESCPSAAVNSGLEQGLARMGQAVSYAMQCAAQGMRQVARRETRRYAVDGMTWIA